MEFGKHFEKRQEEKYLTPILKFNARNELDITVRKLELTMIKPMQNNLIRKSEEEERIAKQQCDQTLAQINLAQQRYMERLEQAKKAGAVDYDDYNGARMDVSSPFSAFERMRNEAREAYREVVKFG